MTAEIAKVTFYLGVLVSLMGLPAFCYRFHHFRDPIYSL